MTTSFADLGRTASRLTKANPPLSAGRVEGWCPAQDGTDHLDRAEVGWGHLVGIVGEHDEVGLLARLDRAEP